MPVLHVPDQFPTIQEAVNAAKPGQVILVGPGFPRKRCGFRQARIAS